MDIRQQDRIMREKLHDMHIPVDADVWQAIEGSLRRRRLRKLLLYASSAVAVVAAFLFIAVGVVSSEEPYEGDIRIAEAAVYEGASVGTPADGIPSVGTLPVGASEAVTPSDGEEHHVSGENSGTGEVQVEAGTPVEVEDVVGKAVAVETGEIAVETEARDTREEQEPDAEVDRLYNYTAKDNFFGEADGGESRRRYTVAFSSGVIPGSSASVSGSTIKASSAGAGAISQSYNIEQISDTRYSLPLNLGIQFQFAVKENLALGIGVNYTMLRSRYDCLINKKQFEVTQVLHYVGIPLNVYGLVVEKDRFNFYVNAGAMFEKGIRAVYDLRAYNQKEHSTASINGVDVSVNAGLGVEYKFGGFTGVYFEPNLVYFINSDVPRSIRTDQPLQVKAELGFRFHF